MRKVNFGWFFFMLSFVFALLSLPNSGAISESNLKRNATASISADNQAALILEGFDNQYVNLSNDYRNIALIKNNTKQPMQVTMEVTPEFQSFSNNGYKYYIKVGEKEIEFKSNSNTTKQITISIASGEKIDMQAALKNSKTGYVITSFGFTAVDTSETFIMEINDTKQNPRRIICY